MYVHTYMQFYKGKRHMQLSYCKQVQLYIIHMYVRTYMHIIIIITSNDDPKPSTVISEQPPTGLIARHIKLQPGL